MIPKKIHYVWVGEKPVSEFAKKCIESWKKYLPDYEIKEWNNAEYEKIKVPFAEQAFKHKKWAFVSDYIRLYALYTEGGLYFDSDVEITQNLDEFLKHKFFSGYENWYEHYAPITAVMGAEKGNHIIKDLLEPYLTSDFETPEGLDTEPNTHKITRYFEEKYGIKPPYTGKDTTVLEENCVIYPSAYFCVPELGSKNYAIHHFDGSWSVGYKRKDLFKLKKYCLTKMKKIKEINSHNFQLEENEKVLFKVKYSKDPIKFYVITKKSA